MKKDIWDVNMKTDIYDVLFWTMLALTLGWVLLKIFGVISTPDWVNYFPIFTLMFAAGAAYQKIMGFVNTMYRRNDWLKNKVENNENRIINLEKGQATLEKG